MRELRAITEAIRGVFESSGYGEISTPALEYETVLTRGDPAAADPAYKLFDEHGNVLVLRSDMTIPIARVVASRYGERRAAAAVLLLRPRLPLRAAAARAGARDAAGGARAGRRARPGGHRGGAHGAGREPRRRRPGGTTGSGSATPRCTRGCSTALAVPAGARPQILHELVTRDFVGLEREVAVHGHDELLRVPQLRGGVEVLDVVPEAESLRAVYDLLAPAVAERVIFDLGLIRVARLLHGRGVRGLRRRARRPDRRRRALRRAARPLRPRPARVRVGAERGAAAHRARRGGPRVSLGGLRLAVPRGALMGDTLDLLDRPRRRHRRGARQRPQAAVRGRRDRHDAPVRRADLRGGGRRRHRDHGQGRARRAVRARRVRAARPRLRPVPDGVRDRSRATTRRPRRCAGWA